MSKFTDELRSVGVYNEYEFAGKGNVFINYWPGGNGRGCYFSRWAVCRPGYHTDSAAHWMDRGNMTFSVGGRENKPVRLEDAKTWAATRYGIKEWAKTPYGSWMDAEFVKKRISELKEQLKAKQ